MALTGCGGDSEDVAEARSPQTQTQPSSANNNGGEAGPPADRADSSDDSSESNRSESAPDTDTPAAASAGSSAPANDSDHEFTNRLINSTSPYLLQHAHNPVDWYPWGEQAFEVARREDKPIFLSVGYSTCYWCHVMERKVFEEPEIARIMNEHFVNIKVDREQRPDVDEIYMMATRMIARRGGWPNSVFLTPDLKPFYAGTYFGPEEQHGRPGFPSLITSLANSWQNNRSEVLSSAERVTEAIRRNLQVQSNASNASFSMQLVRRAVAQMEQRYDSRFGGFGAQMKFPQGYTYPFLFDAAERNSNEAAADMAIHSMRMMAGGGMYDHVGGGFHRYSTDRQWRVPHFEKMLYNQAQLMRAFTRAHERTDDQFFADVVHDTHRYVADLMTGPDGQFYSALDAETDAVEGAYYVWNRSAIEDILTDEQNTLFQQVFSIGSIPRFPGHKHPDGGVLYMNQPLDSLADSLGRDYGSLRSAVDELMQAMKAVRDERKLPRLDDKVIAGWNGMMIDGYAYAGHVLDEPTYIEAAERAAQFVLEEMRDERGQLWRIRRQGIAEQPGFLEDYAFMIRGLLTLHETTGSQQWLDHAVELAQITDELFWDKSNGGYYFAQDTPDLIARSKSVNEGALPSGNSVMAHNLIDLGQVTGDAPWRQRAEQLLQTFAGAVARSPGGHLHMAHAIQRWLQSDDQEAGPAAAPEVDVSMQHLNAPDAPLPKMSSDEHVQVSASATPQHVSPGETFQIRVQFDIADDWHINANPASAPELIPTVAEIRGRAPVEMLEVTYPKGRTLNAPYAETPIQVLAGEQSVVIAARLAESVSAAASLSIPVLVQFQACDDARCLPPTEHVIEVSLEVTQ